MMINPLNPFDKIRKVSEKSKVETPQTGELQAKGDSVEISSEASKRLESQKVFDIALSAPEIRQEKVNEIRDIIARGDFDNRYMNDTVLRQVADRISDSFLGNE